MLKILMFYAALLALMVGLFTLDKKVKCGNIDTSKLKSIDHVICRRTNANNHINNIIK